MLFNLMMLHLEFVPRLPPREEVVVLPKFLVELPLLAELQLGSVEQGLPVAAQPVVIV